MPDASVPAGVHLSAAGVSVVVTASATGAPVVQHWGAALGRFGEDDLSAVTRLRQPGLPHSALDEARETEAVPLGASGFTGTPSLEVLRRGRVLPVRLRDWRWEAATSGLTVSASDADLGLSVALRLELTEEGLVRAGTTVTNDGTEPLDVLAVRTSLPVPARAGEMLDLTGRWMQERVPQRFPWHQGAWLRSSRNGRTGHSAPLLLVAGTPGLAFRRGEAWAVHVAWSGNQVTYGERTPEGECLLGGGELLEPGEVVLRTGEGYTSPWLVGSWSAEGLDAMSHRFHALVRRTTPRPTRKVLVNTWEAVYMQHDQERLGRLVDAAADVGVERLVLDDGWFRGRRDDRSGLGDWTVDPAVWPAGLHPLIRHAAERGMDFGLWVEPEMVSPDSDLARAHPEWILRSRADLPPSWRRQQVLDLAVPGAYEHVRDALLALLEEYPIAYLKWDHNRDLVDVPGAHRQTRMVYRLVDELRARQPGLEIESCASGGARIDLGILARTDRVWPSDTNDALERQRIQRWTTLLVPPEMTGAHIGPPTAHTTGRTHRLELRAATALLGHFGLEWDLSTLDAAEREDLARWVALHKRLRGVVAEGHLVRGDHPDPGTVVTGVVAPDGREAWYVVAQTLVSATQQLPPVRLEGLEPGCRYRLTEETPPGGQHSLDLRAETFPREGVVASGRVLEKVGVSLGVVAPETARVFRAGAVD